MEILTSLKKIILDFILKEYTNRNFLNFLSKLF